MTDYKKIKKYPATKNGREVRTNDSIPISALTEKTDTINNSEFFALDDTNLNQSLKLNLAEHSKQIGEANKVIDSDDIIVSEEIANDLGKTRKLSVTNGFKKHSITIDIGTSSAYTVSTAITNGFDNIYITFSGAIRDINISFAGVTIETINVNVFVSYTSSTNSTTQEVKKLTITAGQGKAEFAIFANIYSGSTNLDSFLQNFVSFGLNREFSLVINRNQIRNVKGTNAFIYVFGSTVESYGGYSVLTTRNDYVQKYRLLSIDNISPIISLYPHKTSSTLNIELKIGGSSGISMLKARQNDLVEMKFWIRTRTPDTFRYIFSTDTTTGRIGQFLTGNDANVTPTSLYFSGSGVTTGNWGWAFNFDGEGF